MKDKSNFEIILSNRFSAFVLNEKDWKLFSIVTESYIYNDRIADGGTDC
mgnify:CR=1 FL=1